jgi:uncharacterized RDD family membrane protein YckC
MAEETLIIETPEHVELHFALASLGNRFLACAADHLLQIIVVTIAWIVASNLSTGIRQLGARVATGIGEGSLWITAVTILLTFIIFFGYFVIFEALWSGQTPGKRWMKLRVIRDDGRPISFFASLTRNLLRLADIMPIPFYSLGIVSIVASERSRRIGDFVAGTVVVKERTAEAPSFDEVFTSDIIDTAMRRVAEATDFRGDVRMISSEEIEVVETFLRRRYDLPENPRLWLAWRVATPLLEKMRPELNVEKFSYEGFLEELLARHRAQVKRAD